MDRIGTCMGERIFLCICIAGVLCHVVYFCFVHCAWKNEISELKENQLAEMQEISMIENYMNVHPNYDEDKKKAEKLNESVQTMLPDELEQGNVLLGLQSMALENRVELSGITPGKKEKNGEMEQLPIEVKFQCGYFSLLDYLKSLQESKRYLQIQGMNVKSNQERLDCQMKVFVYSMKN